MGHTNTSQRMVADQIITELKEFSKSLKLEDKEAFYRLISKAQKHFGSISFASSYHAWALVLFAMLLEMEKKND